MGSTLKLYPLCKPKTASPNGRGRLLSSRATELTCIQVILTCYSWKALLILRRESQEKGNGELGTTSFICDSGQLPGDLAEESLKW